MGSINLNVILIKTPECFPLNLNKLIIKCVCVCVCDRERERQKRRGEEGVREAQKAARKLHKVKGNRESLVHLPPWNHVVPAQMKSGRPRNMETPEPDPTSRKSSLR
jgi:hypothetical protein